jgi:hypothetical protein
LGERATAQWLARLSQACDSQDAVAILGALGELIPSLPRASRPAPSPDPDPADVETQSPPTHSANAEA